EEGCARERLLPCGVPGIGIAELPCQSGALLAVGDELCCKRRIAVHVGSCRNDARQREERIQGRPIDLFIDNVGVQLRELCDLTLLGSPDMLQGKLSAT